VRLIRIALAAPFFWIAEGLIFIGQIICPPTHEEG
jgi:hypothetical protein